MRFEEIIETADFARDPFPVYRRLREVAPVFRCDSLGAWVVLDHANCAAVLKDTRRFSNRGRVTGLFDTLFDERQLRDLEPLVRHYAEGLINIDPPEHTRIRKILQEVFRPTVIGRWADSVSAIVEGLLNEATRGKETLDFVKEFAHPLPVTVISRMYGIPPEDTRLFTRWSAGIVRFMQSPRPSFETCRASQRDLLEMREYIREQIGERRISPTEDVLGRLVSAEVEGDRLTEEEILSTSVTILLGGHETTTRLLGNTVYELLRHLRQLAILREEPERVEKAVEEFLRYCGPFHRDQRVVAEDCELGGHSLCKGDYVLLMLQSANRDPAVFEDPEAFDVKRNARKHLGFGSGPHVCLGAHLARMETGIALRSCLERFPKIGLEEEPDWEFGFLRGPKKLILSCPS